MAAFFIFNIFKKGECVMKEIFLDDIELQEGEEITKETLFELSDNKGDDE